MAENTENNVSVATLPTLSDNYTYVICWGEEAAVVDPGEAEPVSQFLAAQSRKLVQVLITHSHHDHVGGIPALRQATGCEVVGPHDERIPALSRSVEDGDTVAVGPLRLRVMATPGHGASDISFYAENVQAGKPGMVWTGDTLFCGGCGRIFEGTPAMMWDSLSKLAALSEDTLVFCGHEYTRENLRFALSVDPDNASLAQRMEATQKMREKDKPTVPSTIGVEKRTNPFLRAGEPAIRAVLGMEDASDAEVFAELRRRKDRF